jgi:hypothetical protein
MVGAYPPREIGWPVVPETWGDCTGDPGPIASQATPIAMNVSKVEMRSTLYSPLRAPDRACVASSSAPSPAREVFSVRDELGTMTSSIRLITSFQPNVRGRLAFHGRRFSYLSPKAEP